MAKEIYVTREFSVMSKFDHEKFLTDGEFDYKIYTAELLNNTKVKIDNKVLTNYMFNKLYTIDFC